MECYRRAPRLMHPPTDPTKKSIFRDIRAPHRLQLKHMLSWRWQRLLLLLLGDVLGLAVAWQVARYFNQFFLPVPQQLVWWEWLGLPSPFWLFVGITLLLFAQNGLYGDLNQAKNYVKAGQLISLVYLLSLVVLYFIDPKLDLPRSLFFTAWFGSIFLVVTLRLLLTALLKPFEMAYSQTTVFLIAPAARLKRLSDILHKRSHYAVVGAALSNTANTNTTFQAILGSGAKLVLAEEVPESTLASSLYWKLRRSGIALRLVPSSREMLYRRGHADIFAGIPTLKLDAPLIDGLDYHLKRIMDFVGALLGVIVLAPVFFFIAVWIKLDSPGPVFFRQERAGLHGKPFHVWKFRTMAANAAQLQAAMDAQNESEDGVLFKIKADPRVTTAGRFLRRTSLDELPQLFNVLFGHMSLVGPRPLPMRDVSHFETWHHIRHQVLPGMTGLWQISGRSDIDSFDDAARLDLHYIDNWSLNLDLDILLETVKIVLFGKGAY
jgi:exopolysaccharide biosynthesis polyprenyl glycosylphosphotransferase